MKILLILTLSLASIFAYADNHEEGTFDEIKSRMITRMDKQIAHLNEAKSCITAAKEKEALKDCREKMQAARKQMKEEWKSKKEAMKSAKKAK